MQVITGLCLIPIGAGVSVSKEIAACEHVLTEAGLKTKLHVYGTNRADCLYPRACYQSESATSFA